MVSHLEVIARLNGELDRIIVPFLRGGRFAYVDYPDHSNVGDCAIWLGAMKFFARHGVTPSYAMRAEYFDVSRFVEHEMIFLHGGGNFGDMWSDVFWPNCHSFREAVIEMFPDKPIVQLPQTLYFSSQRAIDRTARLIEAHSNFTLLVRDNRSLELAQRNFQCVSILCPDTAFALGPLDRSTTETNEVLFLSRTDKEKKPDDSVTQIPLSWDVKDWLLEPISTAPGSKALAIAKYGWGVPLKVRTRDQLKIQYFQILAQTRLRRGTRLLSGYKTVVSDRLHVHILCTLLGIPHIMTDNAYGKISGLIDAFDSNWDGMTLVDSLDRAVELLQS